MNRVAVVVAVAVSLAHAGVTHGQSASASALQSQSEMVLTTLDVSSQWPLHVAAGALLGLGLGVMGGSTLLFLRWRRTL